MKEPTPTIGHNHPPALEFEPETFKARLTVENADLMQRKAELIAAGERVPETIADEETASRVADFIAQINGAMKLADARRKTNKEPFIAGGRLVDGFFAGVAGPLETTKESVARRLTLFQREQADKERQRREQAERAAREAADAARRAADEVARLARDAAEKAARDAATAEKAITTSADLDAEIAAEAERKRAADKAADDQRQAAAAAAQAEADATAAAKAAAAKPADMHKARGDYGAVASLRRFWDFRDLDRATLDLETLRAHMPQDALEKAVRSFIKAGGRTLKGVDIFENTETIVR